MCVSLANISVYEYIRQDIANVRFWDLCIVSLCLTKRAKEAGEVYGKKGRRWMVVKRTTSTIYVCLQSNL
jgi:hypothetical protein